MFSRKFYFVYSLSRNVPFFTRVHEFLKRDRLSGRNEEARFRSFLSFVFKYREREGTVIIKGENKKRSGEGVVSRWSEGNVKVRITSKGRSNDEYCLESRSKEDRTCETNRNFLPRQKRHRKRMDSECQTLKASLLLFLYYPEGNSFVDLSLPLSAKLVIATWFFFFFRSRPMSRVESLQYLRKHRAEKGGNWISEGNRRTTSDRCRGNIRKNACTGTRHI